MVVMFAEKMMTIVRGDESENEHENKRKILYRTVKIVQAPKL